MRISLKYKLFLIFIGFYGFLVGLFYLFPLDATSVRVIIGDGVYAWLLRNDFLNAVDSTDINVYINFKHWIHLLFLFCFVYLSTLMLEINTQEKPFYKIILKKLAFFLGAILTSIGVAYFLLLIIFGPSSSWGWAGLAMAPLGLVGAGIIFFIVRSLVGSRYLEESLSQRLVYIIFELFIIIATVQILL